MFITAQKPRIEKKAALAVPKKVVSCCWWWGLPNWGGTRSRALFSGLAPQIEWETQKLKRFTIGRLWWVSWVGLKDSRSHFKKRSMLLFPQFLKFLKNKKRFQKPAKDKLFKLEHFAWSHWIRKYLIYFKYFKFCPRPQAAPDGAQPNVPKKKWKTLYLQNGSKNRISDSTFFRDYLF